MKNWNSATIKTKDEPDDEDDLEDEKHVRKEYEDDMAYIYREE